MARYRPQKAKLVARNDIAQSQTVKDGIIQWLKYSQLSSKDTQRINEVEQIALSQGLAFYQVQHRGYLASLLPQIDNQPDPLDRLYYVLSDPAVSTLSEHRSKSTTNKPLTHQKSKDIFVEMYPFITEIVGKFDPKDIPPATLMVCVLADKKEISAIAEDLDFVPDVDELAFRLQEKGEKSSSLYPVVSKDNQFTIASYKKQKNKFSTPKKTDFYDVGEKVSDTMSKGLLDMDEEASDLLMQGYDLKEVVKFHNRAPKGYWEKVSSLMDEDDSLGFDEVYGKLEAEFNFHPDNRELI